MVQKGGEDTSPGSRLIVGLDEEDRDWESSVSRASVRGGRERPFRVRLQPRARKAEAIDRPMEREEPVMRTCLAQRGGGGILLGDADGREGRDRERVTGGVASSQRTEQTAERLMSQLHSRMHI